MDRQEVITVLETLASGGASVDAATASRALSTAVTLLKPKGKFTSAGLPWSSEEDARLGQEFDSGMTVAQIALQHGRTSGAITARLVKLGRLDSAKVKARERGAKVAS
ncbi:MAG: hypothetical protein ACLGH0_01680 [Thermoanaerobaculia bacterium]